MTTGEKLQSLRKENGYTQEELADIVGVSRQSISKWESDIAFPETEKLIVLSKLYHCSVDYLLNEDNNERNASVVIENKEKKTYNKKRLPLIISALAVCLISLILFALTWFAGEYDNPQDVFVVGPWCSYMTYNFYRVEASVIELAFLEGDPFVNAQALRVVSIMLLVVLFSIIPLCILYLCIDKKGFKIAIWVLNSVFFILIVILILLSLAPELGSTAVAGIEAAIVLVLVIAQFAVKPLRVCR